ncbi:glycosyltransferase family 20-domain-containing protein [Pterulicium gracile]|uniref:Glycosyltransferase family 20-domain-containing protein n=1 Tax=Pterulicium gracile TaxID=1884261 RepID=A0A5C3Q2Y6_9AGAR|nr:glycosyltransferase family 20-domain-containing protein [Pterula gracilis]
MTSSFKSNRIVVASLFLPSTVVLGDSGETTPAIQPIPITPNVTTGHFRLGEIKKGSGVLPLTQSPSSSLPGSPTTPSAMHMHLRKGSATSVGVPVAGPLKSIVEDLKDKSRLASPSIAATPAGEVANPFNFTSLAQAAHLVTGGSTPLPTPSLTSAFPGSGSSLPAIAPGVPPRKHTHQTTHNGTDPTRLRRKSSRSSTRTVAASEPPPPAYRFEKNMRCNGGLKNAVDSMSEKLSDVLWVGAVGTATDGFGERMRRDVERRMRGEKDSVPVWIPDREWEKAYDDFCHQVLWPCLHYAIPDAPKHKSFYESASYKEYVSVNQRFADAIIKNYEEGDIIWVNDYHLMLLPLMLRNSPKIPATAPIGFFMHVAFPSSELFRCLSVRKDLLRGVTGADLIGFQTANYARHFRGSVSRVMAWEAVPRGVWVGEESEGESKDVSPSGSGGILGKCQEEKSKKAAKEEADEKVNVGGGVEDVEDVLGVGEDKMAASQSQARGRFVDVGVFPMGIDVGALEVKKRSSDVAEWVYVLSQRYAGMKMIVGRDKLDEVQGVRQKLLAFEAFLNKYPEFQGKVILLQVALQTTEMNELAVNVADIVSRINSKFSTLTYQPIVFLHTHDLTFDQYLALLSVADAFMVCSLREGMGLRTHEFVECQHTRHRPLILSEFTGSYSYSGFRSCIAVNPWDARGTANAIHEALTMSEDEATSRWEDLHAHVTTQTAQAFVTSFLARCVRSNKSTSSSNTITPCARFDTAIPKIIPRFKHSPKRLLFIDLEGSLWLRIGTDGVVPIGDFEVPEDVFAVLEKLVEDRRNEVWLLSGLPVKGALESIAKRVPKVGIVAENGCFLKPRNIGSRLSSNNEGWVNMVANFNLSWKSAVLEILNYFTERTPGAHVEEREASIVWRFWLKPSLADTPDRLWALRQAAEAQNHIFDSLGERFGLRIIPGKASFLVLPTNISRSSAVGALLQPGGTQVPSAPYLSSSPTAASWHDASQLSDRGDEVDFILAISKDDQLLRRLKELDQAETCSTSGKGNEAKWRMAPQDTLSVLGSLAAAQSVPVRGTESHRH